MAVHPFLSETILPADPGVAVERRVCADAQEVGTAVGMYTPNTDEISSWREAGASLFLLSSDQSMMLAGANALAKVLQ